MPVCPSLTFANQAATFMDLNSIAWEVSWRLSRYSRYAYQSHPVQQWPLASILLDLSQMRIGTSTDTKMIKDQKWMQHCSLMYQKKVAEKEMNSYKRIWWRNIHFFNSDALHSCQIPGNPCGDNHPKYPKVENKTIQDILETVETTSLDPTVPKASLQLGELPRGILIVDLGIQIQQGIGIWSPEAWEHHEKILPPTPTKMKIDLTCSGT